MKQADGEFSGEGIYRKRARMRDERNRWQVIFFLFLSQKLLCFPAETICSGDLSYQYFFAVGKQNLDDYAKIQYDIF